MTQIGKLPMKALRVAAGYTQKEVAKNIGVSRSTYMKWENYESYPDALQLINLAKLFMCSLDAFYFPINTSQKLAFETSDAG